MGDHGERSHNLQVVVGGGLESVHSGSHANGDSIRDGADSSVESDAEYYHELAERLISLMETRKPYLERSFTIRKLSDLLGVPKGRLHRCFNVVLKTCFTDLRKKYRVGHAKHRLLEADLGMTTLEAIGIESGFATRSNFYRAFTEETGCSPGSYIRRHRPFVKVVGRRSSRPVWSVSSNQPDGGEERQSVSHSLKLPIGR